jgi:PhnB protein
MAVKPIPEGFHSVTPYIIVEGADKYIRFLKDAFGAEEHYRMPGENGKVMHAEVNIGSSRIMISDGSAEAVPTTGLFCLYVEDVDSVHKRAVAAGAVSVTEPKDQFYGDRSGGVKDFAGNQWWVSTHVEDVSEEEMKRREAEFKKSKKA